MKVTVLGSGTSHGIPVVGCTCTVCSSDNIKNKRTRASILVEDNGSTILVDTATEFRLQAVKHGISQIDGILYTHSHADHLHGLDDIRPLSREKAINLYGSPADVEEIENRFPYIFGNRIQKGGGVPQVSLNPISDKPFRIGRTKITPIPVKHGLIDIFGYKFNDDVAYITDCSHIPEGSLYKLNSLKLLIIGALRYRPHSTHFNIEQALEVIKKISPERAYLTHINHEVDHDLLSHELPGGILPAFDGLEVKI